MTTIYTVERAANGRPYVAGPDKVWLDGTRDVCAIPVKTIAAGEVLAARLERALIEAAEDENARWTMARGYMAARAARVAAERPQLELF